MAPIRILIADDSAVACRLIALMLGTDPELQVVGTAPTGRLAIEKAEQLTPNVLLLDLAMPDMNGLEVLRVVRKRRPDMAVLMFSALTDRAGNLTLDALSLGASDYLPKPSTLHGAEGLQQARDVLVAKVKAVAARPTPQEGTPRRLPVARTPPPIPPRPLNVSVVVIGASTGGPAVLTDLLASLPANLPVPVLITQHMPPVFTRQFAERLDSACPLQVREALSGEVLRPGHVWIAPGDFHLALVRDAGTVRLWTHQGPPVNSCRPAVDVLFRSAAALYGAGVLAVVLTGMGQDGAIGCQDVSDAGGQILVQEPASCIVPGMPRAVIQRGVSHWVVPVTGLGPEIVRRVSRRQPSRPEPPFGPEPSRTG